jgi:hypothetical protein
VIDDFGRYLKIDFNWGITINLFENPAENLYFPDGEYQFIIGKEGIPIQYLSLRPGYYFRYPVNYFYPFDISVYGLEDGLIKKLWIHHLDLSEKMVLFKLVPRDSKEFRIWLDYLEIFRKKNNCIIHIDSELDQYQFPKLNIQLNYYASYKIGWDDDINQNPFGIDFNSFDLINNKLLRI